MESSAEVEKAFLLSICISSLSGVVAEQVLSSIARLLLLLLMYSYPLPFLKVQMLVCVVLVSVRTSSHIVVV